ncbi:MAG TPA: TonB family protein [Polyangia bacterium]|nr:TonB family protein [Polyangia bacterium]
MATRPLFAALALAWVAAGCASSDSARWDKAREAREAARAARPSSVQPAKYDDDPSSDMTVQGEEGTLTDADSALRDHSAEIRECFRIGHRAARPSGRVLLRLFVDGKGEVQDVTVLESSIGNHAIERCIADICLGVMFERPAGNKPTTIDYPVEFRPALASRQHRS